MSTIHSIPPLGELDLHLLGQGTHRRLWDKLGAHVGTRNGHLGAHFAVWAPNAQRVCVAGDFNRWDRADGTLSRRGDSGVWEGFIADARVGHRYKLWVHGADGVWREKVDPFARHAETAPKNASIIHQSAFTFDDDDWMQSRAAVSAQSEPMSIYEVHLGSFMRDPARYNEPLDYRALAPLVADHVEKLGFTHVELLPVMEHPFGGSWGYQVTNYFAPTSRWGTPDDFKYFVNFLHRRGIGVILDWVPAHFPKDEWALARFDGTALYEHEDPRQGEHPDWGTHVFNYGRHEVRNFLTASALYWLDEYHVDGLRVDAVASMLYLDYSRSEGQWVPNQHGGRENLEAIDFFRELNTLMHAEHPGVLMIAEESTSWPKVSKPVYDGGLGFGFKWNMGWMHDVLNYFSCEPVHRAHHHNLLTFSLMYAYSEHFILPLSHDEVVHMKGSLWNKMAGDEWQKFANLRALYALMWGHPGKKLLFMGSEIAQRHEWNHDQSIDWHLREQDARHANMQTLITDLNRVYRDHPALFAFDSSPEGFEWIDVDNRDLNVLAFRRRGIARDKEIVVVANLSGVPQEDYRLGLPVAGAWREVLNTDAAEYGGSGKGNLGEVTTEPVASHGLGQSAFVTIPALSVIWLESP